MDSGQHHICQCSLRSSGGGCGSSREFVQCQEHGLLGENTMIQAHGDFVLMATSSLQPGFPDDCTHESAVTENHVPRPAVGAPVPGTLRRRYGLAYG